MTPLVSVVIPCHNAEAWLGAALESALSQTYPCVEVVVVDDGSTDGSCKIAEKYESRGVRLYRQANAGAAAARNKGLRESRGQYVQFLDADDLLAASKIRNQVDLLDPQSGCVAVCGTTYFRDGEPHDDGKFIPGYPALNSDDPVQWLLDLWTPGRGWGMVQTGAWLVPRSILDAAGSWDERLSLDDDGEYFTRVVLASRGIRWEPASRNYYRLFPNHRSLSGQRTREHCRSLMRSVEAKVTHIMPRVVSSNESQARKAMARMFMDVAFQSFPAFPDLATAAEGSAEALGGYPMKFFEHSRAGAIIEGVFGWKAARRISVVLAAIRAA